MNRCNIILFKNNKKAMRALYDNDLYTAQKIFRENCRLCRTYQTLNNLGVFYIKNGMICENGNIRSGVSVGKKLIEKSLLLRETESALDLLGHIEEDNNEILKALHYLERSYNLSKDDRTLHNISVLLYKLGKYENVIEICSKLSKKFIQSKALHVFALCMHDRKSLENMINDEENSFNFLDAIDQLFLFYKMEKYEEVIKLESKIKEQRFAMDENELILLVDSYIRCGYGSNIQKIRENYVEIYEGAYRKTLNRFVSKICKDELYRKNRIEQCEYVPEIIDEKCEYFGCTMHKTPWDINVFSE